ncbi:hypothetical protein LCGC14_0144840 [marine sediment metagenome]|uniref:Uncharacterized protein n=1 Tax=marine sediment metagenome TaxID=412755 RepID=A0A0F9VF46_9ZZZZ
MDQVDFNVDVDSKKSEMKIRIQGNTITMRVSDRVTVEDALSVKMKAYLAKRVTGAKGDPRPTDNRIKEFLLGR